MRTAVRILGVDPGSRFTGYGCVDQVGNQIRLVTHGTLRVSKPRHLSVGSIPAQGVPAQGTAEGTQEETLSDRLLLIYEGLTAVIQQFKPTILVVEKVFFAKNALSALKLGQARGAVILTGKIHDLSIAEYSPNEVKRAIVGHGHADKEQVARILQLLLGPQQFETTDASDGLALAICHAMLIENRAKLGSLDPPLRSELKQRTNKKKLTLAESLGYSSPKKV